MSLAKYIDDLTASTIQQIFVPVCMPRSPKVGSRPGANEDETVPLYSCDECDEKFVLLSSLKFHKNRCSLVIKYNCRQCCRALVYYNRCNFLAHLRQHNLELNEEGLGSLDVTTQPIPLKMMPYFTLTEYKEANGDNTTDSQVCSSCPECKKTITTTLKEHFNNTNHSKELEAFNVPCKYCGLLLPTRCSLAAHMRMHTKSGQFICPDCCVSFKAWNLFWYHLTNICFHTYKVLRYECQKCTYIFKDRTKLQDHYLSRHVNKISSVVNVDSQQLSAELHQLETCEICNREISHWRMLSHVLAHAKDSTAHSIAYQCPFSNCNFCCCQVNLFKVHINSCLHRSAKSTEDTSNSTNRNILAKPIQTAVLQRDSSEITNGCTKTALEMLKSKGNIVVHKIATKGNIIQRRPEGLQGKVRMPLTPSPEPLSESSVQGHFNGVNRRASHSVYKNKNITPKLGKALPKSHPQNLRNGLDHVNEADVLVVKMHQCTVCKELIAFDGKSDALKEHFEKVHPGKYKLGKIKCGFGGTVNSQSDLQTSDPDSDTGMSNYSKMAMASRNGDNPEDSPPPLLKKQKPLAVSPRRIANANRKEITAKPRQSWEIVSVVDSDDECLLNLKNRSKELQAIGTERSNPNYNIRRKIPVKRLADPSSDREHNDTGDKDVVTDSSSDSGPAYKRKRKRGSSSDPDFECSELANYKPKLRDGVRLERRGRPLGRKNAGTLSQSRVVRLATQERKVIHTFKKRPRVRVPKRKIRNSNESKAYFSDIDNDYKSMGSGLVISSEDLNSNDSFQCLKPDCSFICGDKENFKTHIKSHRSDDNTFQCMECGICFVVKPTFAKHLIINHKIKDVDAYIKENDCCDKEIIDKNINELEWLEKRKVENVPMVLLENQCKICYKVCIDPLSLNIHFRTHGMAFLRMNQMEKNK